MSTQNSRKFGSGILSFIERRKDVPEVRRGFFSLLVRGGFTVYEVNRRPGLDADTKMAELAPDHARAFEAEFGEPVDILGVSTVGSVALQLAADHPDVVSSLESYLPV